MSAPGEQRNAAPVHATGAVELVDLAEVALDGTFRLRAEGDVAELAQSMGRLGQLVPIELRPWPSAGSGGPRWQAVCGFRRLAAVRLLARERVLARLHRDLSDDDAWGLALTSALLTVPLDEEALEALRASLRRGGPAWAADLVDDALVSAPVPAALRERFFEFLGGRTVRETAVAEGRQGPAEGGASPMVKDVPAGLGAGAPPAALAPEPAPPGDGAPAEASAPAAADEPAGEASAFAGESAPPAAEVSPPSPGGGEGRGEGATLTEEVTPEELTADLLVRLSQLNQDLAVALDAWEELPADGRQQLLEGVRWMANLVPYMERRG